MTKRKAILTSILIMIPTAGILVALVQNSFWSSLYFIYALAVFGFYQLWLAVVRWLQIPDTESRKERRNRKEAANA